ncbi:MAG: glycoside hydrolase family 99-like domain-containing protein, partial [Planctomycetota bacterium]
PNNRRLKFSLMWANHDWQKNLHPMRLHDKREIRWPGTVDRKTFQTLTNHVINDYFKHPSHWLIDGCPYFSIYDLGTLVRGFGSVQATRKALDHFRAQTKAAGFKDLHLNAVVWGRAVLPGETKATDSNKLINHLGFDSAGSYVWVHHVRMPDFPQTSHQYVMKKSIEYWHQANKKFDLPYFPNVSMGWDSSPRALQSDIYINTGYPFSPTIAGNTPEAFKQALIEVKKFLQTRPANQRIFTVNCWNEWTEGSYLEPDTITGMKYLQAIKEVFRC